MEPKVACEHSLWVYAEVDGHKVPVCLNCGHYVAPVRRTPAAV